MCFMNTEREISCNQRQPCWNAVGPVPLRQMKDNICESIFLFKNVPVRFIDLGLFFHVLISPVNIWGERLWTEISLNMNKSVCVNVIWTCAFHLLNVEAWVRESHYCGGGWEAFFPPKQNSFWVPFLCLKHINAYQWDKCALFISFFIWTPSHAATRSTELKVAKQCEEQNNASKEMFSLELINFALSILWLLLYQFKIQFSLQTWTAHTHARSQISLDWHTH